MRVACSTLATQQRCTEESFVHSGHVTTKVLQASKQMQIIFLPVFSTMSPKPLCVTGFAATSWLICNLKCDYETHTAQLHCQEWFPEPLGRGDSGRERGANHTGRLQGLSPTNCHRYTLAKFDSYSVKKHVKFIDKINVVRKTISYCI